jgi:glycosyltransferase involved in cell wall biosynthesis
MRCCNRLEYTVLTLREIDRLAGYDNYKVIMIDQASTDGTRDWIKSLVKEGYYKIKPIYSDINLGDFGGTKVGYENLDEDCEYVIQQDNDCVPITEYFLRDMVKIMDAFPKIGQLMLKRMGISNVLSITNKINYEGVIFGDTPVVTCVNMQRRKVVEDINFWVVDESVYWDFILNQKMRERGFELKKIENIKVVHIDMFPILNLNLQTKKYPIYTKNRQDKSNAGGNKINYNITNYNEKT